MADLFVTACGQTEPNTTLTRLPGMHSNNTSLALITHNYAHTHTNHKHCCQHLSKSQTKYRDISEQAHVLHDSMITNRVIIKPM